MGLIEYISLVQVVIAVSFSVWCIKKNPDIPCGVPVFACAFAVFPIAGIIVSLLWVWVWKDFDGSFKEPEPEINWKRDGF